MSPISLGIGFEIGGQGIGGGNIAFSLPVFGPAPGEIFSRADGGVGTSVDQNGLVKTWPQNVQRIEYVAGAGGRLLEDARTNLCLNSSDLTIGWVKTRATALKNATGPDGVANSASSLTEDATAAATHFVTMPTFAKAAAALPYAWSIDLKANGRSRVQLSVDDGVPNGFTFEVDLVAKTISAGASFGGTPFTLNSSRIYQLAGTPWFRVVGMATTNTQATLGMRLFLEDGTGATSYNGDGVSGILWANAQIEQAAFESSRILTGAATVTRAADSVSVPFIYKPQPMTIRSTHIERGTSQLGSAGLWGVGASVNPAFLMDNEGGGIGYKVYHRRGADVTSNTGVNSTYGQTVKLRGFVFPDGSVNMGVSINGGAETLGAQSGANAFAGAWNDALFTMNSRGPGTNGFIVLQALTILFGIEGLG